MVAPLRFDGRTAIITGAGRGMGRSHALMLAARGASVVVNDLGTSVAGVGTDPSPAHEVVAEIKAAGGAAVANTDDVSTTEGAEAMVQAAVDSFGGIDIVIHNAGIATRKPTFMDVDLEDFMKHVSVHLVGAFTMSRAAWPHMLDRRYGRIVFITSNAVLGRRVAISYSAAKAGMIGLAKSLAREGRDHNITVNAIAPSAQTRMTSDAGVRNWTKLPSGEEVPVAPENTSAAVVVLSHESCPSNGEIFGVGARHVGRLFIGDTLGYTTDGAVLVAEDAMDHWDQVLDETDYYVPLGCTDHAMRLRNPDLLRSSPRRL